MSPVTFVTSQVIAMDGVTYTISVYSRQDGFFGFSECRNCGIQSEREISGATREEVIDRATQLMEAHHSDRHRSVAASA
jgi:hypothetical protein